MRLLAKSTRDGARGRLCMGKPTDETVAPAGLKVPAALLLVRNFAVGSAAGTAQKVLAVFLQWSPLFQFLCVLDRWPAGGDQVPALVSNSGALRSLSFASEGRCPGPDHFDAQLARSTVGAIRDSHGRRLLGEDGREGSLAIFGAPRQWHVARVADGRNHGEADHLAQGIQD